MTKTSMGRVASTVLAATLVLTGCATSTRPGTVGITRTQLLTVPADKVDALALTGYTAQNRKASEAGRLVMEGPEYDRLSRIARRLQAQVPVFRDDTKSWKWELALIDAPVVNASCAPGGKITFYTGLIRQLKLTDDEIAMVMGHEIAHALREHGRERMSQAQAKGAATTLATVLLRTRGAEVQLADTAAHFLFILPNSREHESEADSMGLELAARAGYDPKASVSVWQKMTAQEKGGGKMQFLSTHPSNDTRISELNAMIPKVMPLYTSARVN